MVNLILVQDERFMIDPATYRKLHPDSVKKKGTLRDDLGLQAMAQDDPPKGNLLLVFPPAIVGYNLRIKKWGMLRSCTEDLTYPIETN